MDNNGEVVAPVTAQDFVDALQYVLTPDYASSNVGLVTAYIAGADDYYNYHVYLTNAENGTVDDDGTTYVTDGSGNVTVTAADGTASTYAPVDFDSVGVTAVDDKTLEVQLNVPVSYFLSLMYFPTFYPVNEAFYNTCADTFGTSPETVLSNGAFVLTDYQPAATAFAMEKNPDYYDADKIALDGLAYQVIKDSQQALMSYQTGTLDITLLNGEQVEQVKDDPEFTSVGAGYLWYISPNIDAVPDLANLNLRKAMTFALDRDAITGDVLKDGSTPAYTAVPAQFATGPDGSDFSADQTKFAEFCASFPIL